MDPLADPELSTMAAQAEAEAQLPPREQTSGHTSRPPADVKAARKSRVAAPPLCLDALKPGMHVAVAVSGGADSVALLQALVELNREPGRGFGREGAGSGRGLILSVAHMHHGIRGERADEDAAFVAALAHKLGLPLHSRQVDTPAAAANRRVGLEEAARTLRYHWFVELLGSGGQDAVATAHTLNDQAETVLHKLLRGAWTEGLAGIYPVLEGSSPGAAVSSPSAAVNGRIVRPLLGATRAQVVDWLQATGQPWREDESNASLAYTRNRIRHELLPELATFNPGIAHQLAQLAEIAREEEAYWQKEVSRLLPGLLLPGRAVRGGGRASSTLPGERSLAMEVERLRGLAPALVRRLLRGTARELGVSLDFEETARLVALVEAGGSSNPRREDLTTELRAERTPRELRLVFSAKSAVSVGPSNVAAIEIAVPGEGEGFGWRIRCSLATGAAATSEKAVLRAAASGDRVQLRYSRATPKRIKEIMERLGVPAAERAGWPVLTWRGEIVWMRGVVLEPTLMAAGIVVEAEPLP